MKTLKQLREEYNSEFVSLDIPEEFVLEDVKKQDKQLSKFGKPIKNVPSQSQMPNLLMFRRITYRRFPDDQVIALYYSKSVDKYLSIPFGPTGNLNLSEATIIEPESLDEDWQKVNRQDKTDGLSQAAVNAYRRENPGSKLKTAVTEKNPKGSRAARRKSFCSRMGGMKKRLTSAKTARDPDSRINKALRRWRCEEDFKIKLEEKRHERIDEFVLAALRTVGGAVARRGLGRVPTRLGTKVLGRKGMGYAKKAGEYLAAKAALSGTDTEKPKSDAIKPLDTSNLRKAQTKTYGPNFSYGSDQSAIDKSRSQTVMRKDYESSGKKQVAENKISDIRKMLDEGNNLKDIYINGKPITINTSIAKRIVEVYDSVNSKNKRIVENMLNEDLNSFKRLLNFTIRN